jgi:hypothetical protein
MSDLIEAMHKAVMAEVFFIAQPDRGDVFSWLDDRPELMAAALAALRETHHLVPKEEITDWRRREVQAIGAAISTRNWHTLETSYNSLRDKMDRRLALYALEKRHD